MAGLVPPESERSEPLGLNLQTLTLTGDAATVGQERSSKNIFLRPLSFPEPETKDLSHFVDSDKDVPIMCLIPTCPDVFGGVSNLTACEEKVKDVEANDSVIDSERDSDRDSKAEVPKLQFGPKDNWLRHLLLSHKIVIDKVSEISSLRRYGFL